MRAVGRALLLVTFLGSAPAFAACSCEATSDLCEATTLQSVVKSTHEQPFIQMAKQPDSMPQLIAWMIVLAGGTVMLRRRNRRAPAMS